MNRRSLLKSLAALPLVPSAVRAALGKPVPAPVDSPPVTLGAVERKQMIEAAALCGRHGLSRYDPTPLLDALGVRRDDA